MAAPRWPRAPERTTDDVIADIDRKTHELQDLVDEVTALAAAAQRDEERPRGQ